MSIELERSAVTFTKMWCNLFVGDNPDIEKAMQYFTQDASILLPNLPYRLGRDEDKEGILFSHLVDGRGQLHFWQVLDGPVWGSPLG